MQNNSEYRALELITALLKGVKKYGVKPIITALKNIDSECKFIYFSDLRKYIIQLVADEYKIPIAKLYAKKERGDVALALKVTFFFLRKYTACSDAEMAKEFNRVRQVAYKGRLEIEKLESSNMVDKVILNKVLVIEKKIIAKIEKIVKEDER